MLFIAVALQAIIDKGKWCGFSSKTEEQKVKQYGYCFCDIILCL
ncbi:hypothetical protein [Helicobacter didelphidarum]|nr:hypothetical protein [Helicobacter didelphidarum]